MTTSTQSMQHLCDLYNKQMKTAFPNTTYGGEGFYVETDREVMESTVGADALATMLPNDVFLSYDFCTDELTEDQWELWNTIYQGFWDAVGVQFEEIAECDGSGEGLYYGGGIYRMVVAGRRLVFID